MTTRPTYLLVGVLLLLLASNLAVFAVKLTNVLEKGEFVETTGSEPAPIYAVWKAQHGYPVYEEPFRENFAVTFYNGSFYHLYGAVAKYLVWQGKGLVSGARLLTALFTCLAALAFAWTLLLTLPLPTRSTVVTALLAGLVTCFSSAGVSWFYLTVRPDMGSMLFALLGLAFYLRHVAQEKARDVFLASICFFLAWSFKQSTIGILGGLCVATLLSGRWRDFLMLATPFVVGCSASLWLGGATYRFNLLTVPTISTLQLFKPTNFQLLTVFLPNVYVWAVPAICFASLWTIGRSGGRQEKWTRRQLRVVTVLVPVCLAWCTLALMRTGGDRNTLLEAYLAAALLAFILGVTAIRSAEQLRLRSVVLLVAFLASAVFPLAQIASGGRLGDLDLGSQARIEEAKVIADRLTFVPKPIFVEDTMFAEPWHSTAGRYPAVVLDTFFYHLARAAGWTNESGGVEALIAGRHFPALLLTGGLQVEDIARKAGYRRSSLLSATPHWPLALYVLDGDEQTPASTSERHPD